MLHGMRASKRDAPIHGECSDARRSRSRAGRGGIDAARSARRSHGSCVSGRAGAVPDESGTPSGWTLIALGAYLAGVVAVLLLPVDYRSVVLAVGDWLRARLGTGWFGYGWIEFLANVAMFVPLGALLTVVLRNGSRGIALSLALSAAAELLQVALPSREASLRDIAANVLGAAIGAAVVWGLLTHRARARRQPRRDAHPTR